MFGSEEIVLLTLARVNGFCHASDGDPLGAGSAVPKMLHMKRALNFLRFSNLISSLLDPAVVFPTRFAQLVTRAITSSLPQVSIDETTGCVLRPTGYAVVGFFWH